MNKTSPLELAKKLNIPCPNCMKTREELEEAVKDTIMACPDELRKQQIIDQHLYDQGLMDDAIRRLIF